ncbi:hypothetical protein ES695_04275 [Candidatus Atribacteria bacterium 1244-E10-H5-B2]|nr:MAG: hypothetical protein ES695_04275 [Candidatus Atribacteria bacterium 1244-E10-H5-B2]
MEILGYSERGLINSLFCELRYSQDNLQLLNKFLSLVSFPYQTVKFQISEAKILIEQSFSDFGDPDLVLLVNNLKGKQVIFIEAKVKTSQRVCWNILEEFEEFKRGIEKDEINSSNLFVQLYHKVRLVKTLQTGGIKQLQNGVQFPRCSKKSHRKIGNNKIVLKAVNQLIGYHNEALFIALLPGDDSNLRNFYNSTLKDYVPGGFQEWAIKDWGYISWMRVEEFCRKNNLKGTLKNFKWNEGQIY